MSRAALVRRPVVALAAAALAACASLATAPTPEARAALAPDGTLRVGLYPGSPTSLVGNAATGEAKGVAWDLGRELARRLDVGFEPVVFPNNAHVLGAVAAGKVDLAFTNATPARRKEIDFTPTVLEIEQGYLAGPRSTIAAAGDVDRTGVRVGVSQGSTSESVLGRELRQASLVRVPTLERAGLLLAAGELDVFATNKAILFELADRVPGTRVLPGRWGLESFALGIPKGRDAGLPYLRAFAADARSSGLVARAAARAGLRGAAP